MHEAAVIPITASGSVNWRQDWLSCFPGRPELGGDGPVAVSRLETRPRRRTGRVIRFRRA